MKRRTRGKGEGTNEIDVLVGQRLRELRMLAGLSQGDLAATIGLTFQQLQKYERGVNRISASKLYLLACHLNVPVAALFADVDGAKPDPEADGEEVRAEPVAAGAEPLDAQLRSREALVLARHYMRIKDTAARLALKAFVEACANLTVADKAGLSSSLEGDASESAVEPAPRNRRPRGVVWHPDDIGAG